MKHSVLSCSTEPITSKTRDPLVQLTEGYFVCRYWQYQSYFGVAWVSITVTFCQSILSASSTLSSLSLPLDNLRFRMGRSVYHKLRDWLDATSSRTAPTACGALRRWRRRVLQFLSSHMAYLKDTRVGWYPFFLRIRSVSSEMKGRRVLLLRGMT